MVPSSHAEIFSLAILSPNLFPINHDKPIFLMYSFIAIDNVGACNSVDTFGYMIILYMPGSAFLPPTAILQIFPASSPAPIASKSLFK